MRSHHAVKLGLCVVVSLSLASVAQAHGLPEEDKRMMVNGGCAAFIGLGAKHRAAHARAHQEEQEGVPLMPQEELIFPTKERQVSMPKELKPPQ